jgi:glycolate oxidase FAD binding subunit
MRVATAEGTVAKSGGRLVKNVTGFDMHRLYCGSRGTLAVILEASLRLFAEPEEERVLILTLDAVAPALALADFLQRLPLRPLALLLDATEERTSARLVVVLVGRARQVEVDAAVVRASFAGWEEHAGESARDERLRAFERSAGGSRAHALRIQCRPSRTLSVFESASSILAPLGFRGRCFIQAGVSQLDLWLDATEVAPGERLEILTAFSRELAASGAHLELGDLPPAVHAALAPRAESPSGLDWMLRLAQALDPRGTLSSPWFPGLR